jgi:dephospho-CoA kinase
MDYLKALLISIGATLILTAANYFIGFDTAIAAITEYPILFGTTIIAAVVITITWSTEYYKNRIKKRESLNRNLIEEIESLEKDKNKLIAERDSYVSRCNELMNKYDELETSRVVGKYLDSIK